jgi:(2Fe-2S) ferredoxin
VSEPDKHIADKGPFFRHHLFFCCNQRDDGRESCNDRGAQELRDYCKEQVKKKGLNGVGRARVNQAGCLDRCKLGPVLVVYPEGVWYRYDTRADIDAIIDEHLAHGRPVERLRI